MTEERMIRVNIDQWQDMFEGKSLTWNELSMILFGSEFELETPSFYDLEPAPPKDWAQQMKDLEERNKRLSRFIMDWLGRELEKALLKSWRPACYNYSELVEGCAQIPYADKSECRRCPYHEVKL